MTEGETVEAQKAEKPATNVSHPVTLYLFGRTGREKEEWFHRLFSVSIQNEEEHYESTFGGKVAIGFDSKSRLIRVLDYNFTLFFTFISMG